MILKCTKLVLNVDKTHTQAILIPAKPTSLLGKFCFEQKTEKFKLENP